MHTHKRGTHTSHAHRSILEFLKRKRRRHGALTPQQLRTTHTHSYLHSFVCKAFSLKLIISCLNRETTTQRIPIFYLAKREEEAGVEIGKTNYSYPEYPELKESRIFYSTSPHLRLFGESQNTIGL